MSNKEKVDIKRSDQFQEVDEELTRAMAELDSTIERVSLIFQADTEVPGVDETPGADADGDAAQEADAKEVGQSGTKAVRPKGE